MLSVIRKMFSVTRKMFSVIRKMFSVIKNGINPTDLSERCLVFLRMGTIVKIFQKDVYCF